MSKIHTTLTKDQLLVMLSALDDAAAFLNQQLDELMFPNDDYGQMLTRDRLKYNALSTAIIELLNEGEN